MITREYSISHCDCGQCSDRRKFYTGFKRLKTMGIKSFASEILWRIRHFLFLFKSKDKNLKVRDLAIQAYRDPHPKYITLIQSGANLIEHDYKNTNKYKRFSR